MSKCDIKIRGYKKSCQDCSLQLNEKEILQIIENIDKQECLKGRVNFATNCVTRGKSDMGHLIQIFIQSYLKDINKEICKQIFTIKYAENDLKNEKDFEKRNMLIKVIKKLYTELEILNKEKRIQINYVINWTHSNYKSNILKNDFLNI